MKKYIYIMIFALTVIGCGESDMKTQEHTSTDPQVSDGKVAVALPDLQILKSNPINELEK